MFSFSRSAVLFALALSACFGANSSTALAIQSSSQAPADSQSPAPAPAASAPEAAASPSAAQAAPPSTAQGLSVQARIRARREQRRVAAIHEVYSHLYEAYVGAGFTRTVPGSTYQHYNLYMYDVGFTRYFNEKLGVTVDGRGNYGTAYIGNNPYNVNHPSISQYSGMIGPTYRFLEHPRYSLAGRVMAGAVYANFSGDTDRFGTALLNLYPDGTVFVASAAGILEYNVSPTVGLRVAPEFRLTNFGSDIQNGWGVTGGMVYRWGKQ